MGSGSKTTVLIIDEDPDILRLMKYAFAEEEFSLLTCAHPEEGLRTLQQGGVDCVLLNIHFSHTPEAFGFLEALRALPDGKNLPVLTTSSMTRREVGLRALFLGARKFIPKPFYPGEILQEVREALA